MHTLKYAWLRTTRWFWLNAAVKQRQPLSWQHTDRLKSSRFSCPETGRTFLTKGQGHGVKVTKTETFRQSCLGPVKVVGRGQAQRHSRSLALKEEGLWDTTGGVEKAKGIPFPLEFGERNTALPTPGIYLQIAKTINWPCLWRAVWQSGKQILPLQSMLLLAQKAVWTNIRKETAIITRWYDCIIISCY